MDSRRDLQDVCISIVKLSYHPASPVFLDSRVSRQRGNRPAGRLRRGIRICDRYFFFRRKLPATKASAPEQK
jgi:hypothetical protein